MNYIFCQRALIQKFKPPAFRLVLISRACEVGLVKMKNLIFIFACLLPISLYAETDKPALEFSEIWAYLMAGEEKCWDASYPISDLAYFSAGINYYGKLVGVPDTKKLSAFKGRLHLVIAELGNQALTHFCLSPDFPIREALLNDIVAAASDFDGIQIDFEAINAADKDAFISFLTGLKKKLGTKLLSVAVPARLTDIKNDKYDYAVLEKIVDRIIVMAYDEHWSTSKPGAIASINWCKNVSTYSLSRIDNVKLIMGIPFYGRAWADKNPATAYRHAGITKIMAEKKITEVQRMDGGTPYIEYQELVNVTLHYEDALSLFKRMELYKSNAVTAIAFWRLGQEDKEVWKYLALRKPEAPVTVTENILVNIPENIRANLPANAASK
jgi:hypothetical protein